MGGAGFEPAKALPSDLQSDPFDRSGNPPLIHPVLLFHGWCPSLTETQFFLTHNKVLGSMRATKSDRDSVHSNPKSVINW